MDLGFAVACLQVLLPPKLSREYGHVSRMCPLPHLNEGLFSRCWVAKWVSFENRLVEFPRLLANNPQHFVRVEKPEFLLLRLENIHSTVFVTWQGVPGHDDPLLLAGLSSSELGDLERSDASGVSACSSVGGGLGHAGVWGGGSLCPQTSRKSLDMMCD